MDRTITRRECLKFLLAANMALIGWFPIASRLTSSDFHELSNCPVPIVGLGLGMPFTNYLRAAGITTIGKLINWTNFVPDLDQARVAKMLKLGHHQIRERLISFVEFGPAPFATLTRRETLLVDLVNRGYSQAQIAWRFGIGGGAPRTHLKRAYAKMRWRWAPYPA